MSIDAVALVRIPEWEPPEDADVRELDDGALIFLEVPYDAEDDAILNALDDILGDALLEQDDERGVFVLPDASEPEDVETYDEVIAAVGDAGRFIALDPEMPPEVQQLMQNPENLLGHMFEAMGIENADDIMRAMREGDQDALKLAQIQMTSALEKTMQAASQPPSEPTGEPDGNDKKS
jgi:hypothetical protein